MNVRPDVSPTQSPYMREQPTNTYVFLVLRFRQKEKHSNQRTDNSQIDVARPKSPRPSRWVGSGRLCILFLWRLWKGSCPHPLNHFFQRLTRWRQSRQQKKERCEREKKELSVCLAPWESGLVSLSRRLRDRAIGDRWASWGFLIQDMEFDELGVPGQ